MVNAARALTLIGALSMVALGLLVGGLGLVTSLLAPQDDRLTTFTLSASVVALTVGLGLPLAWHAYQSLQGRASRPFEPRSAWVLGLLFLLTVLGGHLILGLGRASALTAAIFPALHVAGATLPALTVVAAVGRSLSGTSRWRDLVLQMSSGAFLSTVLAFSLEFALLIAVAVAALVLVGLQPQGLEQIQALAGRLQDPGWVQNPLELVQSPLVQVGVLLLVAVAIPLLEEAVKTVGVGLMAYRRPTLAQAFLWGLAGGAGFALAEALFNSLAGMDEWAVIIVLRVGATLLHCFTGGLMGLAWYALLAERRWGRALGFYAGSVGTHGLWNTVAAVMAYLSLKAGEGGASQGTPVPPIGVTAIFVLLVTLAFAVVVGLIVTTHYVQRHTPHPPKRGTAKTNEDELAAPHGERREVYP